MHAYMCVHGVRACVHLCLCLCVFVCVCAYMCAHGGVCVRACMYACMCAFAFEFYACATGVLSLASDNLHKNMFITHDMEELIVL